MEVIHVDEELVTLRDLERLHTLSMTVDGLLADVAKQTIVQFAGPPGAGSKSLAFLNPEDPRVIAAERKHRYVDAALQKFGGPLPEPATTALIKQLSVEMNDPSPPCYTSLYKWSKHYRVHNCDRFCLLKEQSFALRGKRLDPQVEAIIQEMIELWYFTTPPAKIKNIHRYVHGQIVLINRRREGYSTHLLKAPSLSTVQRKIHQKCQNSADNARHGSDYVKKHHHSSKQTSEPFEALELAEIDSHLMGINICDENGKFLGHILWFVVILEKKTRSVIGWELSATYPCAEKTIRALKKALLAVPGEERRRGKPHSLHSDNGSEFKNAIIRNFLDRLNISYTRGPPYIPNARARIERFFETLELWLKEQAGTTMSNPVECEYYDAEGEAVYTEASLNRHVEYWIENIYHARKHKSLNMPPIVAWERAMQKQLPPEKFTAEDLDILCRGVAFASVSAAGRVHFFCLSWFGPGLQEIRSKLKTGQKARCYYNPLDLGEIWVAHPDTPRNPVRAYATHSEYQNGLTLTEHNELHAEYLAAGRAFDDSEADVALLLLRQRMTKEYEDARTFHNHMKSKRSAKPESAPSDDAPKSSVAAENPCGYEDIPTFTVDKL
jgi:transposase InsO family protein